MFDARELLDFSFMCAIDSFKFQSVGMVADAIKTSQRKPKLFKQD